MEDHVFEILITALFLAISFYIKSIASSIDGLKDGINNLHKEVNNLNIELTRISTKHEQTFGMASQNSKSVKDLQDGQEKIRERLHKLEGSSSIIEGYLRDIINKEV